MSAREEPRALDWLARRAQLSPSALALVDLENGRAEVSYAAWNVRVERTVRALQERGVGPGDAVAVLDENSSTWLDVWFAAQKLGAVVQALNHRLPPAVLTELVRAVGPKLLLHGKFSTEGLPAPRESFDRFAEVRDTHPAGPWEGPRPALSDPWVLCYTGGTTGRPKAAVLTHETVLWNAAGTSASWGLGPTHRALLNAPLFHTGGMNVFTSPLVWAGGASLVARRFDLEALFDEIERGTLTHFFGVPTMFVAMQAHPRFAQADLSRLELVISGGAPCPKPVFEAFWARDVAFKSGYGLTEAGPNNFWLPPEEVRSKPGAVGYPLLHVETKVVDDRGAVRPPGVAGELWIRGPHVTPGYHLDPEATAAAIDRAGWLHTGDVAVADAEGCHRVVGRKKEMFISGGENVYPAEIEGVLHGHSAVAEAAVVGVPHERWGEVGTAFLVAKKKASDLPSDEALTAWLETQLARYQIPKTFSWRTELPKTGAGKIDKKLLSSEPQ